MEHIAAGQLLGYTIQFPRGLFHLLQCGEGDSVCIEVIGDVATIQSDGLIVVEEDKSSISDNPVTDKSTDLWKTFYNWVKDIKNGHLQIEKTRFLLYTNRVGRKGVVNAFHDAASEGEALEAIAKAEKKLKEISADHEIWKYYNFCVNENRVLLASVVAKFELQAFESGTGFEEVRKELRKKFVPPSQIEFFLDNISGWLQKTVVTKISNKEKAIVGWNEFSNQFSTLFERTRKRELIDFTLESPPSESQIKNDFKSRPCYVRQLDRINLTDDEILEAVADYLRAKVNRDKWIELEIIDQKTALEFEDKLSHFWKNAKARIDLTEKAETDEYRGKLLLLDCKTRQETIRDMSPPPTTIAGTYHALADGPVLGWHKDWEKDFKK